MQRPFRQVDVFSPIAHRGNPVAVVLDGTGLSDEDMQRFANWTNLSETTFVFPPSSDEADYRVRIFTGTEELPFAGHPTLGTCHAWRESGGSARADHQVVQECAVGLVAVSTAGRSLAFEAPPLIRSGPADDSLIDELADTLGVARHDVVGAEWVDNGPGWVAVLLRDANAVLAVRPGPTDRKIGVVGPHPAGSPEDFEVRAFFSRDGVTIEDPVTGSLNASLAQWMIRARLASPPYRTRQGTALGRAGQVEISTDPDGAVWVGGATRTSITGFLEL